MLKLLHTPAIKSFSTSRCFSVLNNQLFTSQLHVVELPNGMRVATKESNIPLACTSLFIKTGPRFEDACNNGISHFIEHMAYQGYNCMSKFSLEKSVYNNGIKLMAQTLREYQVFTAISSAGHAPECVDILSKIVMGLELSNSNLEVQKQHASLEALDYDNNPKSVVFDYLHQTAFQETTLGQSVIGSNENRMKFDKCVIRDFIENIYQPHRLLFVSTGGVSHSTNISRITNCLADLSPNDNKTVEFGPTRYTGSSIIYRDDSMPFAHVAIAVETPGYNSPEYLPLFVASCLTGSWDRTQGGTHRYGSPLARAAATSELCEKFESFYIAYHDIGLWGVYFVGKNKALDDMVYNIQDHWMNMCTITVKPDIQRAVNAAKLKLAWRNTGVIRTCRDIGSQLLYTSEWKPLSTLYEDINGVTGKVIRNMCYKYIYDKCPVIAAVGPTETLLEYTRIRSGMYWLRI